MIISPTTIGIDLAGYLTSRYTGVMTNTAMIPSPSKMKGRSVTGTYMGTPFSGTVTDARYHTLNHNVVIIYIDTPGFVHDDLPRTGIALDVNCMTGGHEPSYGHDYGNLIRFD